MQFNAKNYDNVNSKCFANTQFNQIYMKNILVSVSTQAFMKSNQDLFIKMS